MTDSAVTWDYCSSSELKRRWYQAIGLYWRYVGCGELQVQVINNCINLRTKKIHKPSHTGSDDKSFTESGPTTKDVVCHGSLTEYDKILINFTCGDPIIYYYCDGMSDGEFNCTISFKDSSTQLGHCNNLTSTPTNCESTCDNENKEPSDPEVTYTDSMTKASQLSRDTSTSNSSTTILVVLGALIGLLLVLLVMVTTGLLWTCWLLKRRGGIMFNNELQLR